MRVIAGSLGGRVFSSPGSHRTHPMSDKVRGALFNILGDISGMTILDAFAGSGALSFEAISRGAASTLAIDSDHLAQKTAAENIRVLGVGGKVKLIKASANAWLTTNPGVLFDIILCDPPYDNPQPKLLSHLAERLKPGGIIVFSLPPSVEHSLASGYQLLANKRYGDATLAIYQRIS